MRTTLLFSSLILAGCLDPQSHSRALQPELEKPAFVIDPVLQHHYDGRTDDLATAGLGLAGLRGPAPVLSSPPSQAELRRHAYYQNFRSLLALSDADGYDRLFGDYLRTPVPGTEYLLPVRYSDHSVAAVLMLQVPDAFDRNNPCLVVTASSGSRGIYGATGVVGAWALAQGCAVASTDKGTGSGFHWPDRQLALSWQGQLVADTDPQVHFRASTPAAPAHRLATKHAHSGHGAERHWGRFSLQAAQLGFYLLNEFHPGQQPFTRANTLVIGAGISNGGGALLAAAEQDQQGWLDGVVVSEPNAVLAPGFSYRLNGQPRQTRSLTKQATQTALLGGCASLASAVASPLASVQLPLFESRFQQRCRQLADAGLVQGDSLAAQADDALRQLRAAGLVPAADALLMTSAAIQLWESVAVNYLNSYSDAGFADGLCGLSYAFADAQGHPVATPEAVMQQQFGNGGIVPTGGLQIINDQSAEGPRALYFSVNGKGETDLGFDRLRCLDELAGSPAVHARAGELAMTGQLHQKPVLLVQGRADNLIQPDQHARPYLVLNQQAEGKQSQLRYLEISHGQHFDAFLGLAPLRTHYVPLHGYFEQALNQMLAHLRDGQPLPPSQSITAQPVSSATQALVSLLPIALNEGQLSQSPLHQAVQVDNHGLTINE